VDIVFSLHETVDGALPSQLYYVSTFPLPDLDNAMTTSPAYQFICNLLIEIDSWGRIARRQWLIDAGLEPLEAHLPPDLPAINFAPALLDVAYQQGNDHHLRLMVTALQEVMAGHPNHLNQVNALLAEPDLMKVVFPTGRVAWAEDRATTLAVAKAYFNQLPTDKVPAHVSLPDVPFTSKSHMLFVANPAFVGREMELMAIAEGIKTGQGAVVAAGIGGVGKTQLAVEWVHRYGRYFAGGIFWLDFSNEGSIPLTIASAGAAYQHPHYAQMELADQVRWVREQWKAETPTLLIFDNCEDPKLADEYAPIGSGARVLATSHDQTFTKSIRVGGVRQINIETLPRLDSIKLLQRLRPDLSETDANAIAEELGDLPLALHIAGSFLQQYRTTSYGDPSTYLERLCQPDLLEQLGKQGARLPHLPTKHERDVTRTFLISIERLDSDTHPDPNLTRALLLLIAQFAPGVALPSEWLNNGLPEGTDELDMADALKRLKAVGLVDTPQEGMTRIHRIIAQVVTEYIDINTLNVPLIRCEDIILQVRPEYKQLGFLRKAEYWIPHAQYITIHALTRHDEQAILLTNYLGLWLKYLALYKEATQWVTKSLELGREILGTNHHYTSGSLNNLAELYRIQGFYQQSLPLYEEALAIAREVLDTRHPDIAQSLSNLGLLNQSLGKYKEALPLFEEALEIRQEILGTFHSDTAQSLSNLAGLYQAQGEYKKALPLYQEALDIDRKIFGSHHPETAIDLSNLGMLYQSLEKFEKALPLVEEALAINIEVWGLYHPDTATDLSNLATLYYSQGKYGEAATLCKKALEITRKIFGSWHTDTARSLNNLAVLYSSQGNYNKALPLLEEALAIERKLFGVSHINTAATLNNLAELYYNQRRYEYSLPLLEEAVSIAVKYLGKRHPHTKIAIENLDRCRESIRTRRKYR
jgi:tetratricopeptide (TPR) repeat protein